jgi:hypothetical protein
MKLANLSMTEKQKEKFNRKKAELAKMLEKYPYIGVVGRVSAWLEDSDYRYPISCTMMPVLDSMEEDQGIEYSWRYVSKALRYAAGVVVDLTQLRPAGASIGKGGVSSGVTGFVKFYSTINEVLRRGGAYKNGAVVVNLNISHPDAKDFLNLSPSEVPWIKRTMYVSNDPTSPDYLMTSPLLDEVIRNVSNGTLWLSKISYDKEGKRIYSNVCNGILLPPRGTCLLTHVNLGQCDLTNIRQAFRKSMKFLCELHKITGAGEDNYYLSPKFDKQVGLGVLGLANLLAKYKISYKDFTDALENFLDAQLGEEESLLDFNSRPEKLKKLIIQLSRAFEDAAVIARRYKMDRAFTVEPTASCSFRYTDTRGFTTTPEISPPICHPKTKGVTRDSTTFGQQEYFYPKNVETAEEVGWDTYYRLCQTWQRLMETTGLAHSISFNIWNTCTVDKTFLQNWLDSPLVTTYYRMMVEQGYLDKSSISTTLSDEFSLDLVKSDFFSPDSTVEEDKEFCFLTPENDTNFCSACAE